MVEERVEEGGKMLRADVVHGIRSQLLTRQRVELNVHDDPQRLTP